MLSGTVVVRPGSSPYEADEYRLLVVDDDMRLLASLTRALSLHGFNVATAASARDALPYLEGEPLDVIVLDVSMPGMDGLTFCSLIRRYSSVPILMLTARDEIPDRIAGLEAGADDYVVKPFSLDELVARLRALLRRSSLRGQVSEHYAFEGLHINRRLWKASCDGASLPLTNTEFLLLLKLMSDPERVFSRDDLLRAAWEDAGAIESNVVDVHIANLRRKLESAGPRRFIRTVRGVGYALRAVE